MLICEEGKFSNIISPITNIHIIADAKKLGASISVHLPWFASPRLEIKIKKLFHEIFPRISNDIQFHHRVDRPMHGRHWHLHVKCWHRSSWKERALRRTSNFASWEKLFRRVVVKPGRKLCCWCEDETSWQHDVTTFKELYNFVGVQCSVDAWMNLLTVILVLLKNYLRRVLMKNTIWFVPEISIINQDTWRCCCDQLA